MGDDDDEGNDVFIDKSCSPNSCHKRFFFTLPHQQFFEGKLLRIKLPIIYVPSLLSITEGEKMLNGSKRE